MGRRKISQLTAASALDGTEQVELNQGGASKRVTTQEIADLGGGGEATEGTLTLTAAKVIECVSFLYRISGHSNSQFSIDTLGNVLIMGAPGTNFITLNSAGSVVIGGPISVDFTGTASGTTGAQVINKTGGTVNFAAGQDTLIVTNNLSNTTSLILVTVYGNDLTAKSARVIRGNGSFTIVLDATATAETTVGFLIMRP
jgi:hypothetical protein